MYCQRVKESIRTSFIIQVQYSWLWKYITFNFWKLLMKRCFLNFQSFLILGIFAIFVFLLSGCSRRSKEIDPNIITLDSLMRHSDEFMFDHLKKIEELKQKRHLAHSLSDKYFYDNLLFEGFYTLNADSAWKYVNNSIEDAKNLGNKELETRSLINKSNLLAATGLLKGALDVMEGIDTSDMSQEQLIEYYGQMVYLYSHLGNYTGGNNRYYVTERLYKDSVMNVITPSHPDYLWYKSWDILGSNQNMDSVINALKQSLDKSKLNERQDAKNAYALARLYEQKGDMKNYEHYMALSAIIDVKISNAEIASLEDLASYIFEDGEGDVDRAYKYINYSLQKALNYPNRSRAFGISQTLEKINKAYQEKIIKQKHDAHVFLILLCVAAGFLIFMIVDIIFKNKKLKKQRQDVDIANEKLNQKVAELSDVEKKLHEMNSLLKELNSDLTKKNSELYEANFVKEEYIGYVFKLCSSYIAQIEDFKRNIYLKAVKKQWKDIENSTADIDMKEELKEFYHSFDTIFLHLYPTFVSDFNLLLKPDKQIVLKDGELLNMELRIYALVRLGITDSVKIADFLHCAPQTVYNYRLRARSRTMYNKIEFTERVKSIGNFLGMK